jgi:phenylacetate-CoA ligase
MDKLKKLVDHTMANYYIHQLKKDQWKDPQQLKRIQFKKLKAVLKHAYDYVPYYHRLFKSVNIRPDDIRNFEDVRKISPLSKKDVQQNFTDMVTRGVDKLRLSVGATSGSTGIPLKVLHDPSFTWAGYQSAVTGYIFSECGVRPSDNFVTVWGRASESIRWGKKYVRLWRGISETVVPLFPPAKLVRILRLIKPDVLSTFPSVLITLADYDVSGIHPRIIFTGGEVVTEHCREVCRKTSGLEPFEGYGCVEFGNLAFECNEHCGLHMITNIAFIEFVDEAGEWVSPGEQGELVVTGFLNYVMPFIRYRIGDLGIPANEKCACGRSWPLIKSIQGRINDFLVLPSGRKISYLYIQRAIFHKVFRENIFAISQYQIIQDRKDRIILKIVKGREFKPEILDWVRKSLENEFDKLGEPLEVTIEIVEEIPMEITGKRRLLISKAVQ